MGWLFADASDEEVQAALDLFNEDREWIKKISENYHTKKIALLADDVDLWKKILQDEENLAKGSKKK